MRAITFRPRNTLGLDLPLARAQRRRGTTKSSCRVGDSSQSPRHLRSRVAFVLTCALAIAVGIQQRVSVYD